MYRGRGRTGPPSLSLRNRTGVQWGWGTCRNHIIMIWYLEMAIIIMLNPIQTHLHTQNQYDEKMNNVDPPPLDVGGGGGVCCVPLTLMDSCRNVVFNYIF